MLNIKIHIKLFKIINTLNKFILTIMVFRHSNNKKTAFAKFLLIACMSQIEFIFRQLPTGGGVAWKSLRL